MNEKEGMTKSTLHTLLIAACVLIVSIVTAIAVALSQNEEPPTVVTESSSQQSNSSESDVNTNAPTDDPPADVLEPDEQLPAVTPTYVLPVENATLLHGYEFYYNSTLNCYYEHSGLDFAAQQGSDVFAIADGKVISITEGDVLMGNQITVEHNGGVTSVYSFINPDEGVKVGDSVRAGQKIGTIAEPTGEEYKDGAHLHLEIYKNGDLSDPNDYLSLSEK